MVRSAIILLLLLITISCDQASKQIVRRSIRSDEMIPVISNNLTLTRVENPGSFLGMGKSLQNPFRFVLLSLLPALFLIGGTVFLLLGTRMSRINVLGFIFVLGGGCGNVLDRIMYGSVTDFIHIRIGPLQTGVFNVADMCIMTGIFILLVHSYIRQSRLRTNL